MRHDLPPDSFRAGLRAAIPIAIGYLPAAFAFGAAATGIGLGVAEVGAMSAIVFSGANQAFLLAAIPAGMAIPLMILLTSAASLRHLLYGLVLRGRIAADRTRRAVFALGLTDEVFATALAATANGWRPGGRWLIAVALTAWAAWTGGSIIGAAAGDALRQTSESAAAAMGFALPALFIGLMLGSIRREVAVPVALAAAIAALAVLTGHDKLAIPGGALACLSARWFR